MDETTSTAGIMVSAGAVGSICTLAAQFLKSHFGSKQRIEPCPLPIKKEQNYVTVGEFNTRCGKIESDISALHDKISNGNSIIISKLDEIDKRNEQRIININQRVDPLIASVAATNSAVEFIKEASLKGCHCKGEK